MKTSHDNNIVVKYATDWQRGMITLLWLTSPCWLLVGIPTTLYCVALQPSATMWTIFLATLVPALSTILLSNTKLRFDRAGIVFPPYLAPFIGFRTRVEWSEVRFLRLETAIGGLDVHGSVIFGLSTFEKVTIDLRCLNSESRAYFMQALKVHASNIERELEFAALEDKLALPNRTLTTEQMLLEDKQLTLLYSKPLRLLGLWLTLLLFPIWGVLGVLGTLAIPVFVVNGNLITALLLLSSPLFLVTGIVATACLFDTTLTVGEAGMSFPLYMAPLLHFHRERGWTEVSRLRFISRGHSLEQGVIDFCFKSGVHVPLFLKHLTHQDLEKLLLALNIWAHRIDQDPEIKILQEALSNQRLGHDACTYTRLWEDEMNRRFSSTNFVPLEPGRTLRSGHICLVKQLAFGGLSAIYLAQVDQTELVILKEFVVPEVTPELKAKACELFDREAIILMKLSHPYLARVRDYFVEDARTYIVLDYIPGTDLRQIVMQKGSLPEETVVQWAKQIGEILAYLHCQEPPVIHRDLTPDNILLTANNQIALIDFGAANEFVGTATGTLVGKQSFIAPEQFRGDTIPQSDLYSLGATLFYLLTGDEPEPLSQSFPKEKNPQLSDALNRLVGDCTAFEPHERIQSIDKVLERLAA